MTLYAGKGLTWKITPPRKRIIFDCHGTPTSAEFPWMLWGTGYMCIALIPEKPILPGDNIMDMPCGFLDLPNVGGIGFCPGTGCSGVWVNADVVERVFFQSRFETSNLKEYLAGSKKIRIERFGLLFNNIPLLGPVVER